MRKLTIIHHLCEPVHSIANIKGHDAGLYAFAHELF